MAREAAEAIGQYLTKGQFVCIEGKQKGIAAKVLTTSPGTLGLELLKPVAVPFQVGEQIRITHWDKEPLICCWEVRITQVGGPAKRHLMASILDERIERRKLPRFYLPLPFSLTVIEAVDTTLTGKKIVSETRNLTLGGLLFDTFLNLPVGDKLALALQLSQSQHADAFGWVVRSERVRRTEYVGGIVVKSVNSVGIEFLQLDEDMQVQLLKFLLQSQRDGTSSAP